MIRYIDFDTIESTNAWAKLHFTQLKSAPFVCIRTEEQTAGYGRFNRTWISPKSQNICATLVFSIPRFAPFLGNIAQVLSYSCACVLKEAGFDIRIKWPNDLQIDYKKVAGFLCEALHFEDYTGIILGLGINVNTKRSVLDKIDQPATSLEIVSGQTFDRHALLDTILNRFILDLGRLKIEGFSAFHNEYTNLLIHKGELISCINQDVSIEGMCLGVTDKGHLIVQSEDRSITHLAAGDTTRILRPKKD
jgi:BirA family biotin operon repressor/biotin-[acetyl-CoA-carboxylase] ligase